MVAVSEVRGCRPSLDELGAEPETLPVERLELQLRTHAAHMAVAMSRFLALVAEYDRRRAYESWECSTCARWLELHCQVGPSAAHEYVRVARALQELPAIAAVFAAGEMSYSKVRAVTRVATPDNEADMLALAREMNANQFAKVANAIVKVVRERTAEQLRRVEDLRGAVRQSDGNGLVTWVLRMSEDEDATLQMAIEAARDRHFESAKAQARANGQARVSAEDKALSRLDAILGAVEAGTANETGQLSERYLQILEIDTDQSGVDGAGAVLLANGIRLHPAVARRLGCDAAIQLHMVDGDGGVRMGRRIRTFTNKQRQMIAQRYATCGFPGCDVRAGRCQFHHYVHWTGGGNTDVDNGVPLCRKHHRAVHEGGWRLWRDRGGTIHAESPRGQRLQQSPALPAAAIAEYTGLEALHDQLGVDVEPWQQFELAGRSQLRYITDCVLESPSFGFCQPPPDSHRPWLN